VGWEDPSPRARPRSPAGDPAAQPGYGDHGVRLSFVTIVLRAVAALLIGGVTYAGAHHGLVAWLGSAHAIAVLAISVALAVVVGWLLLRVLMRTPESGGRGRRGWADSSGLAFDDSDVGGAVGGVVAAVGAVVDAATD
jgi:formate hydrogenlyase subunit 3/multisubunit Na+/H+ antiporter MnhD subunit